MRALVVVCSLFGGYTFTWPLWFMVGLCASIVLREQQTPNAPMKPREQHA